METYTAWKSLITSGGAASAWQRFYVYFYQSFIEKDRWRQYLEGVGRTLYVTVIRGTPMMVQLLIMGFVIFSSSKNFALVGALTLGINSGAYQAEIIRGGLMSIDSGQMEAGRSLGLGYGDTMRFIVVPQAIKAILPALGNEFIVLLKDTSLISVIGGKELLYAARAIVSRTYEAMFPFLGAAAIYLALVMIFTWLLGVFERRLRQSDRR